MKLSKLEYLAMNNPVRRSVQKKLEFRNLKRFLKDNNIDLKGRVILDAGCGSGYSTLLIQNEFHPSKLTAFDFMPEQIKLAKRRNLNAELFVGSITGTGLPSNSFDAVFVFGVLHHVKDWAKGLEEVVRVLKPGGALIIEELGRFITHASNLLGFNHPKENRFNWEELEAAMDEAGLRVLEKKSLVKGTKSYLCKKIYIDL
jgi:ubiquinone/menaquinone biosynthesis C-methylase UbiE